MSNDPFWKSLPEERREKIFAMMRRWGEETGELFRQGQTPHGQIAVGGALFSDYVLPGAIRMELVAAMRTGTSLGEVHEKARLAVKTWVAKHNEKSPEDRSWQRWEEHGQDKLNSLVAELRRAVGEGEIKPGLAK